VNVAELLADDRTVLGLHESIVIAVARSGLGELDQEFVQQLGNAAVDELGTVVRVKSFDRERELFEELCQKGDQEAFADALDRTGDLKLGHLIDGIDVVNALLPVQIPLVDRIDPDHSGLAVRIGLTPFTDLHVRRPSLGELASSPKVSGRVSQVVEV